MIRSGLSRSLRAAAQGLLLCLSATLLAACSSGVNRPITSTVGVTSSTVSLSTDGAATSIQWNTTLGVTASLSTTTSGGVTWSLNGPGSLSNVTSTTVTYVAPTTEFPGTETAVVTATSTADTTQTASVAISVLGAPSFNALALFPGFANIPYAAAVSVGGGLAPFTWTVSAGALPPGIALNGSTVSVTTVSGTPTTAGTYTFTLQATDANNASATTTLTLVIGNQQACLLQGQYAFLASGFRGGGYATHAGSIAIDGNGNITGEQDYKDGNRTTAHETITSGTCTNRSTNSGILQLNAASGSLSYDFSVTPPDSGGVIHSARLQLIGSGGDSATGELALIDATALTGAAPAGAYAFGLIGVDAQQAHFGTIGRLTADSAGNVTAGAADSNEPGASLTQATLTGALSAMDAHGRGTATLSAGGRTYALAYYVLNAKKMYLINVDTGSGNSTPRQTGYLTPQVGDSGGATFDNAALAPTATPSILSLWGAFQGVNEPLTAVSLGRLSNAATGAAGAGTVAAIVDSTSKAVDFPSESYSAQPYTIDGTGRGTLQLANADGTRSFVFYLDGVSDGYLLETGSAGSTAGGAGLLEAQTVPSGGAFTNSAAGGFVGGTQFAQAPGPMVLEPLSYLQFGTLASSYSSGSFQIDSASGRGLGTLSETGIGVRPAALYLVSPTKMDVLTFATLSIDGSIEWMVQN